MALLLFYFFRLSNFCFKIFIFTVRMLKKCEKVNVYRLHCKYMENFFQMSHEVSSCEPIRKIVFYSRAAVCDYALDPFVSFIIN